LINNIKAITGDIGEDWKIKVTYKTKEEILDDIRFKEPDLVKILERNNPLPETIIVSNIKLDQYKKLNSVIENKWFLLQKQEGNKDYFANYTSQYLRITHIIDVLSVLQIWLNIIIWIFLVSISIIIYSIIGNFIYYYRDEIYITKLVWGSNKFIYWPFVIQGSIYSFIAFSLSFIIFVWILGKLNWYFWELYTFNIQWSISILEMIVFVIIWWFAGFLSSKKYLK
jgi:cell division protein FtsX